MRLIGDFAAFCRIIFGREGSLSTRQRHACLIQTVDLEDEPSKEPKLCVLCVLGGKRKFEAIALSRRRPLAIEPARAYNLRWQPLAPLRSDVAEATRGLQTFKA